ncbi:MAG: radical SAM protein [Verrucomicrobia bacterium]|nr:radical SAM protein [Verrucomicrobiota bacterium]
MQTQLEPAPVANRFVRLRLCPRAHGLCVDVNLNPDCHCNFDCVYCSVNRRQAAPEQAIDLAVLQAELQQVLKEVEQGRLAPAPGGYSGELRHVAISGDGEPTLCPQFTEAVEAVLHVRAVQQSFPFRLVLVTNATRLDRPEVQDALRLFTSVDEIWVKLDAGSQEWMNQVNRPSAVSLEAVLANILNTARRRPVVVQSLFPAVRGRGPAEEEIDRYAERLRGLVQEGAKISRVQIYSASQPVAVPECGHLPLRTLSGIARRVRDVTGLKAEVC